MPMLKALLVRPWATGIIISLKFAGNIVQILRESIDFGNFVEPLWILFLRIHYVRKSS